MATLVRNDIATAGAFTNQSFSIPYVTPSAIVVIALELPQSSTVTTPFVNAAGLAGLVSTRIARQESAASGVAAETWIVYNLPTATGGQLSFGLSQFSYASFRASVWETGSPQLTANPPTFASAVATTLASATHASATIAALPGDIAHVNGAIYSTNGGGQATYTSAVTLPTGAENAWPSSADLQSFTTVRHIERWKPVTLAGDYGATFTFAAATQDVATVVSRIRPFVAAPKGSELYKGRATKTLDAGSLA